MRSTSVQPRRTMVLHGERFKSIISLKHANRYSILTETDGPDLRNQRKIVCDDSRAFGVVELARSRISGQIEASEVRNREVKQRREVWTSFVRSKASLLQESLLVRSTWLLRVTTQISGPQLFGLVVQRPAPNFLPGRRSHQIGIVN